MYISLKLKIVTLVSFLTVISFCSFAQDKTEDKGSLDAGTIKSQYDYIWGSSNKYQDHRVVKAFKLDKFKNNVLDSIQELHSIINGLNSNLSKGNSNQSNLNNRIDSLNTQLSGAIAEKDSFGILGVQTSKPAFKSIFWIITGILTFLVIFSFFRLKSKTAISKESRSNFSMLENEFEDFKKRSREKEQILARQLQDEINKSM